MTYSRRKAKGFYRKSGSTRPITGKAVTTMHGSNGGMTYNAIRKSRQPRRARLLTRKERSKLATLENEMLYQKFVKKLKKLNEDFDEELIDRTHEPTEALLELKRKHPELDIGLKQKHGAEAFRDWLSEMGIENERVQNLVGMQDSPLSEEEINQLSYIINMRPKHAAQTDAALKAPVTKDIRKWLKHINRYDLPGVDAKKQA